MREGRARFTGQARLDALTSRLLGYFSRWQGALLQLIVIEVPVHYLIIVDTSTWALEAMLCAECFKTVYRSGPVDARRPRGLLQMFQREQRQGSRPILSKFNLGELPSPIAAAVRFPIFVQERQNAEQLRLLEATGPRMRSVEGVDAQRFVRD